jgi:signal transduction histidine kinase
VRPDASQNTQLERELNYYRRECNDMGARLLRLQEEQSQSFREARRSRTVVKLLREAYRLGDVTAAGHDIGGQMLEIVVENALCDRAALLREEPLGSGRFLLMHTIGLAGGASEVAVTIADPPAFFYTATPEHTGPPASELSSVLQLPYVLWTYDRASGHALLIGNRCESNVNRPFEAGDQELIEGALSVYLDVLYRKHAEAQLRQAKQAAEASGLARREFLEMLAEELRLPLTSIVDLARLIEASLQQVPSQRDTRARAEEIREMSSYVVALLTDAMSLVQGEQNAPSLDVEWLAVDEVVRSALRAVYARSVRLGVELDARMPKRRIAICVDRIWMQHVLQHLVSSAVRVTSDGGSVRVAASRRSEGGLEVLVSSGQVEAVSPESRPMADPYRGGDSWAAGGDLSITRRLIEAHGGTLTIERTPARSVHARLILPAEITRDDDLAEA